MTGDAKGLPDILTTTPPWSASQLRKLGKSLRDGSVAAPGAPGYEDVIVWYGDLATAVQTALVDHDWSATFEDERPVEVTSRAKTIDTLREKLVRSPTHPLSNIQDIAGVRVEAEMCLTEQSSVARAIAEQFGAPLDAVKDIRMQPHSGYRAVHIWLRLPAGHVEVQVRTHLQGLWANAYEAAADVFGRNIRYGELPNEPAARQMVHQLQVISTRRLVHAEWIRDFLYRIDHGGDDALHVVAEATAYLRARDPARWRGSVTPEEMRDHLRKTSRTLESKYTSGLAEAEAAFRRMELNGGERDA